MEVATLLPDPAQMRIDHIEADAKAITVFAVTIECRARCPSCGAGTERVHSRYVRTVCDLPWQGIAVRIRLTARRFFCDTPECKRSIFTERLPGVVAHYARRPDRLQAALAILGYALGGEAGARLAVGLGLCVSPDTLLRRVRQAEKESPAGPPAVVRVLGVDDWAFRRGQRYGTILVDLEKRRLVDLLPDRSAESLADWLRRHPGVEIISRDRCELYADGGRAGAPDAKQIADRWHLLKNVGEAMDRALIRHHRQIREAATQALDQAPCNLKVPPITVTIEERTPREPSRAEREKQEGRARRLARWSEVRELHRQGMSQLDIRRKTGVSTKTIRRYIRSANCPYYPLVRRTRRTLLSPFEAHLKTRWEEGCHNAATLYKELRGQGFSGGYSTLRAFVRGWRGRLPPDLREQGEALRSGQIAPSPRTVRWWLLGHTSKTDAKRRAWQENLIDALGALCPEARVLQKIACDFAVLLKDRCVSALTEWLEQAEGCGVPEMAQLAKGMRRDIDAVTEAVRGEWSNGQTEGQVNRLKLIKRSMYGRAFCLCREQPEPGKSSERRANSIHQIEDWREIPLSLSRNTLIVGCACFICNGALLAGRAAPHALVLFVSKLLVIMVESAQREGFAPVSAGRAVLSPESPAIRQRHSFLPASADNRPAQKRLERGSSWHHRTDSTSPSVARGPRTSSSSLVQQSQQLSTESRNPIRNMRRSWPQDTSSSPTLSL